MGAGAGKTVVEGQEEADAGNAAPYKVRVGEPSGARVVAVAVKPKKAESEEDDTDADSSTSPNLLQADRKEDLWAAEGVNGASAGKRSQDVADAESPRDAGFLQSAASAQPAARTADRGGLRAGLQVRIVNLEKSGHLNGREAVTVDFDATTGRWLIRMATGEEKRIRPDNLQAVSDSAGAGKQWGRSGSQATTGSAEPRSEAKTAAIGGASAMAASVAAVGGAGVAASKDANKELESLLLQTNWSAIYQLFHQRFGIANLERLDRGYNVKCAVEMTLSIVAKCFALLRSDPHGRLHCTPLHIAALQSSTEAVEVIVRDLPYLVTQTHTPSHSALCPLHIAILCGCTAIVELLLEGDANPNVRTLHDVSPLHLAATTSKDICQMLVAYAAEPGRRDVMGSTSLHYAAAFKQQSAIELLLSYSQGSRAAADVDQKRVTPLHISCALYTGDEDLTAPMALMVHGAKPWQADCTGAAARELVPWSKGNVLQTFFETHGNSVHAAAQQWLDEKYLAERNAAEAEAGEAVEVEVEGESDAGAQSPERNAEQASKSAAARQPSSPRGPKAAAVASPTTVSSKASAAELTKEVERLRAELQESSEARAALEREKNDAEHLRAKVAMLEQSAANQQKVFDGLQALYESERQQHQLQVESLQLRSSTDRADAQARMTADLDIARAEIKRELAGQFEEQLREANQRAQEARADADAALARAEAAESEAAAAAGAMMSSTLRPSPTGQQHLGGAGSAEQEAEIEGLQGEVQRLQTLEEQARGASDQLRGQVQELRAALRSTCSRHALDASGETPTELLATLDGELGRLRQHEEGQTGEVRALHEELQRQQAEAAQLRHAREAAEDRATQVERERQEAAAKGSAASLKLETKLQDMELEHSQALGRLRGEAEACQRRAEAAEGQAREAQPMIDKLSLQMQTMEVQFADEQRLRKKYHNQIQDMKGAIRVFCRFRPFVDREREAGDVVALRQVDAFSCELLRTDKEKQDARVYNFDAIFDGDSTQEDVFADCRDLVQSAVDGYNVTIFAYGQTGAGKTHTMYGTQEQPGLAPRSIRSLFEVIRKEQQRGNKTFKVKTYMIEVYKQDILDLLADNRAPKDGKKGGLEVKKDVGRGMMYVEGVTERQISSPEELMATLAEGEKKRHVTATKMNSASSRSHLLLSIIIECMVKDADQVLYGKITLCDLAGSERPKKSEVSGDGLKEAIEINKSLSALGDVIESLTKGSKSIPYRNHKLTMLMQDSLGGSAKTLMFVNCSPAGSNSEETQTSLKWASRARQVTNDVKRNADSKEVARLKQVIAMMSQAQNAEVAPEEFMEPAEGINIDMQMAMNATMRAR